MTPAGLSQLKADEGCEKQLPDGTLAAYPDPLSGGEPWTIAYGATGAGITQGTIWTQDQADADIAKRVANLEAELPNEIVCFPNLSGPRQDVLTNMAYNLGLGGLMAFTKTISAIENGQYSLAASEMLNSQWAEQVPNRAARLSQIMADGVYSAQTA